MKILLTTLSLIFLAGSAYAVETVKEKEAAKAHDVKREEIKSAHRAEEQECEKTDKICLAKKAKNRTKEATIYTQDKVREGVNKVDNKQ
ncbi:MAG: hypothetical protein V4694_04955 [Pseudomonadota bacterium]